LRAQGIHARGAHRVSTHQAGIAQHPEVMRHAGLGPTAVQLAATGLGYLGQPSDNFQTYRVAQRVEHTLEPGVAAGGTTAWPPRSGRWQWGSGGWRCTLPMAIWPRASSPHTPISAMMPTAAAPRTAAASCVKPLPRCARYGRLICH